MVNKMFKQNKELNGAVNYPVKLFLCYLQGSVGSVGVTGANGQPGRKVSVFLFISGFFFPKAKLLDLAVYRERRGLGGKSEDRKEGLGGFVYCLLVFVLFASFHVDLLSCEYSLQPLRIFFFYFVTYLSLLEKKIRTS